MHIAICDDERQIREELQAMIKRRQPDCETAVFASGDELLESGFSCDILFLDIQMEGLDGIRTAREIRKRQEDVILIFITAVREYVFDAFDVSAFHYLLKPLSAGKLAEVLERAVREVKKKEKDCAKKLLIHTRTRNLMIPVKDIYYIESLRRKAGIHTMKEIIEIYATMSELEEQLGKSFYRCHRGYLVNMAYITEYQSDQIRLCTGESIYMSKDKYQDFVKAYMHYLREGGTSCV